MIKVTSLARARTFSSAAVLLLTILLYSQSQLLVGYTVIAAEAGGTVPVGTALFTYVNSGGVLISQAGVGASEPILSGRLFVDESGPQTGIALVNPSRQDASATLILRNASGQEAGRTTQTLKAGNHLPIFVFQLFKNLPASFIGSLTFESNQKLAAIALRQSFNALGEPLYSTLPVVDLAAPPSYQPIVFPQIAAGGGYTSQLLLINTTSQKLGGKITLVDSKGSPLVLSSAGTVDSQFSYTIDPNGSFRADLDRSADTGVGYALLTPDPGTPAPAGSVVFLFKKDQSLVTEAGVAATSLTTSARIFADNVGASTGVALANPAAQPAVVTFTLLDRFGSALDSTTRSLPAKGHIAIFANQLFPSMSGSFTGLMEINSPAPIAPITLKLTTNQRNDDILTTLPVADLTRPPTATSVVFAQIAIGGGFSTRLIFINPDKNKTAAGRLSFFNSDASPMSVPMGDKNDVQFAYQIAVGGGRQFLPGNTARISSISPWDFSTNLPTREIVVNEGQSSQLSLLIRDETGKVRDDFDFACASTNTDVATVDGSGKVQGKKAGFSTLTISSGAVVTTTTATVVTVTSGVGGFDITGLAQDRASRLYLANSSEHTILLAQDLKQVPAVYAGVSKTPGLKNEARLQSWFKSPSFLVFNQADGSLYVSDTANNVIRRAQPGSNGRVETLAGTGESGSRDGPIKDALFNNPQGVALDGRGSLWIADSGNHTIRRISLTRGTVETIAGNAGSSGWVDAPGNQARFSSPAGIAIETETLAQQLQRELSGAAPPAVSVIVADTGNGILRRVKETGEVETIRATSSVSSAEYSHGTPSPAVASAAPVSFNSPVGIALDSSGNIYVTEPGSARVRTLLQNGSLVSATQAGTFSAPRGVVSIEGGKIVVADQSAMAKEIRYGEPRIASITPNKVSLRGGEKVLVKGSNFAPDTLVIVAGVQMLQVEVRDTETISFTAPSLSSGLATLTLHHRGGLAQSSLQVDPIPLKDLPKGYITTIAGGSTFAGDGGAAKPAGLFYPARIAIDNTGNYYIADSSNNRIRKVRASTGVITTVAGTGVWDDSGDGGPAVLAGVGYPYGVALDPGGNLLIADTFNNRIRRISAADGIMSTVAGSGALGYSGDNGAARSAALSYPYDVKSDAAGNLYIADNGNNRIRKVSAASGVITTVAGSGSQGFSGDNGPATAAALSSPSGVALDGAGNLYIADTGNHRIRKVNASTGVITTAAGNGTLGLAGDNGPAISANLASPYGIELDPDGNMFIADTVGGKIRKVNVSTGIITTVAGRGTPGYSGDEGPATAAQLQAPYGATLDAAGNIYIADTLNQRVRRVSAVTGIITTIAGDGTQGFFGENIAAGAALFWFPYGVFIDGSGNVLISDTYNHRIRKVDSVTNLVTTLAGTGSNGYSGDNGPARSAGLSQPSAVAQDPWGFLTIADTGNHRIRGITTDTGTIITIAGTGTKGFSGDGGLSTSAQMASPSGMVFDSSGILYVSDTDNHRVRAIGVASDRTIRIIAIAGNGTMGFAGDGGNSIAASLSSPWGLAFDKAGNGYIADTGNSRIRRISATTGIITTVAGNGQRGFAGDNGPAVAAQLRDPKGIAFDSSNNLYIADSTNGRIRRIDAVTGIITTVAGSGKFGNSGDNGPATAAGLVIPYGVAVDAAGNLYIADSGNHRIRAVRGPIP